jgi:hypothetical protein
VDEHGEAICGDTMLLLFNADHANTISFVLPPPGISEASPWELVFDTAKELNGDEDPPPGETYPLQPCSMVVLQSTIPREEPL